MWFVMRLKHNALKNKPILLYLQNLEVARHPSFFHLDRVELKFKWFYNEFIIFCNFYRRMKLFSSYSYQVDRMTLSGYEVKSQGTKYIRGKRKTASSSVVWLSYETYVKRRCPVSLQFENLQPPSFDSFFRSLFLHLPLHFLHYRIIPFFSIISYPNNLITRLASFLWKENNFVVSWLRQKQFHYHAWADYV